MEIQQRKQASWTECTALGFITTPHSQPHECPEIWIVSVANAQSSMIRIHNRWLLHRKKHDITIKEEDIEVRIHTVLII